MFDPLGQQKSSENLVALFVFTLFPIFYSASFWDRFWTILASILVWFGLLLFTCFRFQDRSKKHRFSASCVLRIGLEFWTPPYDELVLGKSPPRGVQDRLEDVSDFCVYRGFFLGPFWIEYNTILVDLGTLC